MNRRAFFGPLVGGLIAGPGIVLASGQWQRTAWRRDLAPDGRRATFTLEVVHPSGQRRQQRFVVWAAEGTEPLETAELQRAEQMARQHLEQWLSRLQWGQE